VAEQGDPLLPGPVFATGYRLAGDDVGVTPYGYARYANPTWSALEAALGKLEDAEALVFASGSAAIAAVMFATLSAGDAVVVPGDGYPAARTIAAELTRLGVEAREVPTDTQATVEAADGAALVLVETPSNPRLDVVDVRAVAAVARRLIVDNTLATPLGQRPLDLGADATVLSGSKHLTGHGDVLLGSVATRDPELLAAVRRWRDGTGAILGPFEAWLAHRSLATLAVRLERQEANAAALVDALRLRDDVEDVRWPRVGSVLCFTLADADRAQAFLDAAALVTEATSFGGLHSTAERRARWGTDDVAEGWIRFSAGIEDTDDLVADVAAALDATR
jgi:cystathionine gamma-lyase